MFHSISLQIIIIIINQYILIRRINYYKPCILYIHAKKLKKYRGNTSFQWSRKDFIVVKSFVQICKRKTYIFSPRKIARAGKKWRKRKGKRENFRSDHRAREHAFLTESNSISLENWKGTCVDFHERPLEYYHERPAISGCRSKRSDVQAERRRYLNSRVCTNGRLKRRRMEDGEQVGNEKGATSLGRCLASTEIKNIDSHSHAGLHRSSIRFSPARQYLFFPRTVRGTNCSCIPRLILPFPSLSLSLSPSLRRNPKHKGPFSFGFSYPLLAQPLSHHTRTGRPLLGGSRPIPRRPTSSHTTSPRESTILFLFLFHFSFFGALLRVFVHVCAPPIIQREWPVQMYGVVMVYT